MNADFPLAYILLCFGASVIFLIAFILLHRHSKKRKQINLTKANLKSLLITYKKMKENDSLVKAINESNIPYSMLVNSGELLCIPYTASYDPKSCFAFPDHQLIEDVCKEVASFVFADLDLMVKAACAENPSISSFLMLWNAIKRDDLSTIDAMKKNIPVQSNIDLYYKITYLYDALSNYGILLSDANIIERDAFFLTVYDCALSQIKESNNKITRLIDECIEDISNSSHNYIDFQFLSYETVVLWKRQHLIRDEELVDILYSICDYEESSISYHLANRIYLRSKNIIWITSYNIANTIVKNSIDAIQKREYVSNLLTGKSSPRITIQSVDKMDPALFEHLIASLFVKMGYNAHATQKSRDQGVDVIAVKHGRKSAIQAKCYHGSVGNSAIQEVVAGKSFYQADDAYVITNSTFTKAAIQLADVNHVKLWDRKHLAEILDRYNFCEADFVLDQ